MVSGCGNKGANAGMEGGGMTGGDHDCGGVYNNVGGLAR